MGSVVGLAALRWQSPLVAAKAAILRLTRSMALDLGGPGVTVNAVAPGSVVTGVTRKLFDGEDGQSPAQPGTFLAHIPWPAPAPRRTRSPTPSSPEAGYIAGQALAVDGGRTAGFMG